MSALKNCKFMLSRDSLSSKNCSILVYNKNLKKKNSLIFAFFSGLSTMKAYTNKFDDLFSPIRQITPLSLFEQHWNENTEIKFYYFVRN